MALVETNPSKRSTVCIPSEGTIKAELLLIDPIRDTIDDLVKLSICGDLRFLIPIGNKDVVIFHEGDMSRIW